MLSLTKTFLFAILISARGEMSEWFKELVLKTSDSARNRGFESHSLRQETALPPRGGALFFLCGRVWMRTHLCEANWVRMPRPRSGSWLTSRGEGIFVADEYPTLSAPLLAALNLLL